MELNGEEIADSSFIIKELSQKFEKDLDACEFLLLTDLKKEEVVNSVVYILYLLPQNSVIYNTICYFFGEYLLSH